MTEDRRRRGFGYSGSALPGEDEIGQDLRDEHDDVKSFALLGELSKKVQGKLMFWGGTWLKVWCLLCEGTGG